MPLGNLTSQFFANVYLHELDLFVKHQLQAKYYLRYVDDFVLLHHSFATLNEWKQEIDSFLSSRLSLQLHPDKTKIKLIYSGTEFLGLRVFPHYRLIKQKNLHKFQRKWSSLYLSYAQQLASYDSIYDFMEGWCAYAKKANTYKLRQRILSEFEEKFHLAISHKEISRGHSLF